METRKVEDLAACFERNINRVIADSHYVERCKPYQVLMTCGHIETRMMREATAGVPWTPDTVLKARADCAQCDPSKWVNGKPPEVRK